MLPAERIKAVSGAWDTESTKARPERAQRVSEGAPHRGVGAESVRTLDSSASPMSATVDRMAGPNVLEVIFEKISQLEELVCYIAHESVRGEPPLRN